ncbi:hypothetical protein ACFX1Z_024293 [Malus domestica]
MDEDLQEVGSEELVGTGDTKLGAGRGRCPGAGESNGGDEKGELASNGWNLIFGEANRRPSGEKIVVRLSYLLDIFDDNCRVTVE